MPIVSNKDDSKEITEHVVTGVIYDEEMFACQAAFYDDRPYATGTLGYVCR